MSATHVPSLEIDPFADEFLTDPYPHFAAMREVGPIVHLGRYDIWAMARHAELAAILTNWEAFSSARGVGLSDFAKETPWRPPSIVLEVDPPLHSKTHAALMKVLSPAALQAFRDTLASAAEEIVDDVLARSNVDGVTDIASAFPLRVFPDAVGVRPDGREKLLLYGNMVFNAFGPRNERLERSLAELRPVTGWIDEACERGRLSPEGIGAHLYALADAGDITVPEAALLVRSLLAAGLDTTVSAIGNALFCFARFPDQWAVLRDDPSLARNAFDEACRFESPVQTFFRTTTCNVEIGGATIDEGSKILMFLASANRDPHRWENADVFDIRRRTGGHLGFGHGIHRCVGEMFAKLEGEALLAALARRVKSIAFAGEPVQRLNNTLRCFAKLPLVVEAA